MDGTLCYHRERQLQLVTGSREPRRVAGARGVSSHSKFLAEPGAASQLPRVPLRPEGLGMTGGRAPAAPASTRPPLQKEAGFTPFPAPLGAEQGAFP